jgi:hypothetical protein
MKDVSGISDVDFCAGDAAWASEFPKAVCPGAFCKVALCCRMFEYLKAGMATAEETRIPIRTPRMNCHRIAERCRSRGTSRVILGDSGVISACRSNVMVFECLPNCRHHLQRAGGVKNCRGGRPMGGVRPNQQPSVWYSSYTPRGRKRFSVRVIFKLKCRSKGPQAMETLRSLRTRVCFRLSSRARPDSRAV